MRRRPPRSTLTHSFPTRRSADLQPAYPAIEHAGHIDAIVPLLQMMAERRRFGELQPHILDADVREMLPVRSEEHTSELQSLMRISYDVFCLKKQPKQPYKDVNIDL